MVYLSYQVGFPASTSDLQEVGLSCQNNACLLHRSSPILQSQSQADYWKLICIKKTHTHTNLKHKYVYCHNNVIDKHTMQ